jgi:predicted dehydrogenase
MLNVALVGSWHVHAKGYAEEISKLDGVKIAAVWDDHAARGQKYAELWKTGFEPNLDALLARSDIDAALVACSTNLHLEVIPKCAKAGKHIFTEKVLAASYRDAVKIGKAVRDAGIRFCISLPFKSFPHNVFAKELVEKGTLGTITGLRIRDAHNGASGGWLPETFYDPVECQGGAMLDLGAHPMYLSEWLLGKPISVVSLFGHHCGRALEDNASSVLEFSGGVLASAETSLVAGPADMSLELYGTKGWYKYSGKAKSPSFVRLCIADEITPELPKERPGPIEQWVREITAGERTSGIGIDDAETLSLLMDGAYRADRDGRKVRFDELNV